MFVLRTTAMNQELPTGDAWHKYIGLLGTANPASNAPHYVEAH